MVFLTGATGYVGKYTLEALVNAKVNIKALVRKNEDVELLKQKFSTSNVNVVVGDLSNKELLSKALKDEKVVIHLAASVHGAKEDMLNVNINGLKNLIYACKKNKVKKIVFLSSMAVKRPYLEDYAHTKLKGEKLLLNSEINVVILRPTMIFGKDDFGFLKVVKQLNMFPLFIPVFGNGKYTLAPIFIDDVVKTILTASSNKFRSNGIYELGGKIITFNDFVMFLKKKYNIKKFVLHIPLFLAKFGLSVLSIFIKKLPINKEGLVNATTSSDIDTKKFIEDFGFEPISFGDKI